jgi:arylsulfatase A-like enzyme
MQSGAVKYPYFVAALAGAALFALLGILDVGHKIFSLVITFIFIRTTVSWLDLLANLDMSAPLLLVVLLYGAFGLGTGILWWWVISRVSSRLQKLRKKEPSWAEDFFALYLYVGLSLFFFLIFVCLIFLLPWLYDMLGTIWPDTLIIPAGALIAALLCYALFRGFFWITNKLLSLPVIRAFRHPAFHGVSAGLILLGLLIVSILPSLFHPEQKTSPSRQIYFPKRTPPIVFVVLDTCRADHFGAYGYPKPTTPNFDALAKESVLFHQAIAPSPWTLPSHASMFTGLYPRSHGADFSYFQLDSHFFTLAEFLQAAGYYTIGLSSNPAVGRISRLNQGFDRFEEVWRTRSWDALVLIKILNKIRSRFTDKGAREINRLVARWLDKDNASEQPFFLFINYLEAHEPYRPPSPYRDRFLSRQRSGDPPDEVDPTTEKYSNYVLGKTDLTKLEIDDMRSMYDAELAYQDMRLGELMETLKHHGILKEALLIVVADHGENLGEHRLVSHAFCVYDTLIKVPFLLRYPPQLPAGKQVAEMVDVTSLFPTILEFLGVPEEEVPVAFNTPSLAPILFEDRPVFPVTFSQWRSPVQLLKALQSNAPASDFSRLDRDLITARSERYKYILTSDGTDELYDLLKDPGEEQNLCDSSSCSGEHPLRVAIDHWKEQISAYIPSERGTALSDHKDWEALKKLKTLGYIK